MLAGCLPRVGPLVTDDAGTMDAGAASCSDGSLNGDESDLDCGGSCPVCADSAACGSALDCLSGVCTAGQCAAPASRCGSFSGCTTFTDLTAPAANRTINFPGSNDRYSPPCIRIRFGQSVTFQGGDFGSHPLRQGCGPISGSVTASSGQTTTRTFNFALGTFGYFCDQHGSASGSGMAGAIEVVR